MNSQFPNNGYQKIDWNESDEYVRVIIKASKRQYKISLDTGKVEYEKYPGLKIGDKVNYTVSGYTGEWRVLDIGENYVKLLATSNVETLRMDGSSESLWDETTKSYKNGENKLDEICKKYINETYATEAKSIKVEDIDKITEYKKTGYGTGEVCKYNNKVTYKLENGNIKYKVNSEDYIASTETKFRMPTRYSEYLTETYEYEVISNYYSYDADIDTKLSDTTNNVYRMMFGNDDQVYWLSSTYVNAQAGRAYFGIRTIRDGRVHGIDLWDSRLGFYSLSAGVRPVVTLKSDIKLTQTSENSGEWNISK